MIAPPLDVALNQCTSFGCIVNKSPAFKTFSFNLLLLHIFTITLPYKIKRWLDCFKKYHIKKACMVDGDDLCFDYNIYKESLKKNGLVACNKNIITGIFTNTITFKSLEKIYKATKNNKDTEMIEPFIKKSKIKKNYIKINTLFLNKKIRLTFDYKEDWELLKKLFIIHKITEKTENFVKYLLKNKRISSINYFREENWKNNQLNKINLIR